MNYRPLFLILLGLLLLYASVLPGQASRPAPAERVLSLESSWLAADPMLVSSELASSAPQSGLEIKAFCQSAPLLRSPRLPLEPAGSPHTPPLLELSG